MDKFRMCTPHGSRNFLHFSTVFIYSLATPPPPFARALHLWKILEPPQLIYSHVECRSMPRSRSIQNGKIGNRHIFLLKNRAQDVFFEDPLDENLSALNSGSRSSFLGYILHQKSPTSGVLRKFYKLH